MVGASDIAAGDEKDKFLVSESRIESNTVQIKWSNKGIYSWIDKTTSTQLIREDNLYNAFTPIYEVTNATNDPTSQSRTRSRMRRNRKKSKRQDWAIKYGKLRVKRLSRLP